MPGPSAPRQCLSFRSSLLKPGLQMIYLNSELLILKPTYDLQESRSFRKPCVFVFSQYWSGYPPPPIHPPENSSFKTLHDSSPPGHSPGLTSITSLTCPAQRCPEELSVMMKCPVSALSSMAATNHVWPRST